MAAENTEDSNYLFVEVAAQRCAQLMRGAKPKLDLRAHKFTTLATVEVKNSLIPWEYREPDDENLEAVEAADETDAAADA